MKGAQSRTSKFTAPKTEAEKPGEKVKKIIVRQKDFPMITCYNCTVIIKGKPK